MAGKLFALAQAASVVSATLSSGLTWPSSSDELEDLMFLNTGYNSRGFTTVIQPCTKETAPGRSVAAGFLRTAFHDMAAHDVSTGQYGLDASIGFEMAGTFAALNAGPAFNNSINYYAKFYNPSVSMADLVALGAYSSVAACGGPELDVRSGRVDATGAGAAGLPDPRDSVYTNGNTFTRMGMDTAEMIELVACGHTLGAVHGEQFGRIIGKNDGFMTMDASEYVFDNKIATEFIDGTTKNPLVNGPETDAHSDFKVFTADNNVTISRLASSQASFDNACQRVLTKMIDTVPSGVSLSQVITPYVVKPYLLALNLANGGQDLAFSGQIRMLTTTIPVVSAFIKYQDRNGGSSCGDCKIELTKLGDAQGIKDSFAFYGFSETVSAKNGISSFKVIVNGVTYDNNGKGFPVDDSSFAQTLASSSSNGQVTLVAASRSGSAPALTIYNVQPMYFNTLPYTQKTTASFSKTCTSGDYTFFTATFTVADEATSKFSLGSGSLANVYELADTAFALDCTTGNSTITTTTTTTGSSTVDATRPTGTDTWSSWNQWKNQSTTITTTSSSVTAAATTTSASKSTDKPAIPTIPSYAAPSQGGIDWNSRHNVTIIVDDYDYDRQTGSGCSSCGKVDAGPSGPGYSYNPIANVISWVSGSGSGSNSGYGSGSNSGSGSGSGSGSNNPHGAGYGYGAGSPPPGCPAFIPKPSPSSGYQSGSPSAPAASSGKPATPTAQWQNWSGWTGNGTSTNGTQTTAPYSKYTGAGSAINANAFLALFVATFAIVGHFL